MKRKKTIPIILTIVMILSISFTSSAMDINNKYKEEPLRFIVNNQYIVVEGEDWENVETGEYFRWEKDNVKATTYKNFSFKIRSSVTSSEFTINSTSVSINSNASVVDNYENVLKGYSGHKYKVSLKKGLSIKSLNFSVSNTESGSVSGLTKGGKYKVEIVNVSNLPSNTYLYGSGSIKG